MPFSLAFWTTTLMLTAATAVGHGWVHSSQKVSFRGGARSASSSSGSDSEMEVWCDCSKDKDASGPQALLCDALVFSNYNLDKNDDNQRRYSVQKAADKPYDTLHSFGQDQNEEMVGIKVNITEDKGQQRALEAVGSVQWILAYATNNNNKKASDANSESESPWLMIPAENLIGAATQSGTKIAFVVERAQDVVGLSQALQVGVDALCVASTAGQDIWDAVWKAKQQRAEQAKNAKPKEPIRSNVVLGSCWRMPLSTTTSSSSGSSVVADRVCIDFVRNLSATEGCWIGSSAKIMALVLSEAATSSFVPSRPFRVNAGPVHSYVTLADGIKAKYLCELQAGDEVLVYDAATDTSRPVAVGRLKIEVRPCVVIGLLQQGNESDISKKDLQSGQIFLQQAETVRLGRRGGDFVRVTDLDVATPQEENKRQSLLLRVTSAGTHVGGRYAGKVDEK